MSEWPSSNNGLSKDTWEYLKKYTRARIALGRAGTSLPTQETLHFKLAHAHAKDALLTNFESNRIQKELEEKELVVLQVQSNANHRTEYLKRPDLGRTIGDTNWWLPGKKSYDILIVVADGLSPQAMNEQATSLVLLLHQLFSEEGLSIAPIVLAKFARVAIGDAINDQIKARLVIVLIGERPGLSAYNSCGAYITLGAASGFTDEKRNCISNIHSNGLSLEQAASKIVYLSLEALRRGISGVGLKDSENNLQID
ncbi:MAG: ethanolamine ammonia-lyase subunit EutC [Chitinophagaceae bacterium]|nr:ethanolamine ammonia-lyase subunit EutC [Chitinophagaceae bacterium]